MNWRWKAEDTKIAGMRVRFADQGSIEDNVMTNAAFRQIAQPGSEDATNADKKTSRKFAKVLRKLKDRQGRPAR